MRPGVKFQLGDTEVFRQFRKTHFLPQKRLAALVGISLRELQNIKGRVCHPTYIMVGKFRDSVARHQKG